MDVDNVQVADSPCKIRRARSSDKRVRVQGPGSAHVDCEFSVELEGEQLGTSWLELESLALCAGYAVDTVGTRNRVFGEASLRYETYCSYLCPKK